MPDPKISTVLYDEVIPIDAERSLRLHFDLAETLNKSVQYADQLTLLRQIPMDLDNITPRDPMLLVTTQHFMPQIKAKVMSEAAVMNWVVQHYTHAKQDIQRDSILIAMFSHPANLGILSEEPEPYPSNQAEADPLIFQMPAITKNIAFPLEKRLKRLSDLLTETGAMFRVQAVLETLSVRINVFAQGLVEVDEAGFQPAAVDGDVPPETEPAGVQREVQTKRSTRGRVSGSDGSAE